MSYEHWASQKSNEPKPGWEGSSEDRSVQPPFVPPVVRVAADWAASSVRYRRRRRSPDRPRCSRPPRRGASCRPPASPRRTRSGSRAASDADTVSAKMFSKPPAPSSDGRRRTRTSRSSTGSGCSGRTRSSSRPRGRSRSPFALRRIDRVLRLVEREIPRGAAVGRLVQADRQELRAGRREPAAALRREAVTGDSPSRSAGAADWTGRRRSRRSRDPSTPPRCP